MRPAARYRPVPAAVTLLVAWLCCACGGNFVPTQLPVTGDSAEPLGQVFDVEISLPHFFVPGAPFNGLYMTLRLEVERSGPGLHNARYVVERSSGEMGFDVKVEDVGPGQTTLTVSQDAWTSGRIGPLKVETIQFEMLLDGVPENNGRFVGGQAWESQNALSGSFSAWSRHRFLVASSDLSVSGRVAEVSLLGESFIQVRRDLTAVSSDPVARRSGTGVFILNRLSFDNIQQLDPEQDFQTAWQRTTGIGANPHDLVQLPGGRLYVTRYEPPFNDLAVLDNDNGVILGTVPLGALAENRDGTPRADRIVLVDGTVFVGLQDIDRTFTRFSEGKLAVVNPDMDQVVGVIPLGGKNPVGLEVVSGGDGRTRLYVALAGIFPGLQAQELSGGVVVVDVANRAVERLALDDDVAGGNISGLAMATEALGYVVVSDAAFRNRVLAFDPVSGVILRTVFESPDFIAEIEVDGGGVLAVPAASLNRPRLCLYGIPAIPTGVETELGCGDLEQPPLSVEALD